MGYGILQVKVKGDEYSDKVICNFDWHALPGLTEEWRTDPMPLGHAQASLPGLNKISGVLADGKAGMGIYHHLPKETYSSATAFKSYHFIEDKSSLWEATSPACVRDKEMRLQLSSTKPH